MKSTYERMGGSYHQEGDYLMPDLEAPENPQIGIWGERRRKYLQTNKRVLYMVMLLGDTLNDHLAEVDKSASEMFDLHMKEPKRILVLSPSEYRLMLYGLLHVRNKLLEQGGHPDAINELLMKLQRARRCRHA